MSEDRGDGSTESAESKDSRKKSDAGKVRMGV